MAFTRIPSGASSAARVRLNAMIAPFDAAYAVSPGPLLIPAADAMLTI